MLACGCESWQSLSLRRLASYLPLKNILWQLCHKIINRQKCNIWPQDFLQIKCQTNTHHFSFFLTKPWRPNPEPKPRLDWLHWTTSANIDTSYNTRGRKRSNRLEKNNSYKMDQNTNIIRGLPNHNNADRSNNNENATSLNSGGGGGTAQLPTSTTTTTITITQDDATTLEAPVLRLTLRPPPHVSWDSDVINNEGLGRKSSKRCCIFHKQRAFGESSTESSDNDSDGGGSTSSSSSGGGGSGKAQRPMTVKKKKRGKVGKSKVPDYQRYHA